MFIVTFDNFIRVLLRWQMIMLMAARGEVIYLKACSFLFITRVQVMGHDTSETIT